MAKEAHKRCSSCGADNPADYTFCFHCNAPAEVSPDDVPTVRNVTTAGKKKSAPKKKTAKK